MKAALHIILCCLCLSTCRVVSAADTPPPACDTLNNAYYDRLKHLPGEKLLSMAEENIPVAGNKELALAALAVITQRYYTHPGDAALRGQATVALRHLGNLQMSYDIDYRKALKNLLTARLIAEEDKNRYQLAYIYNSLANIYYWGDSGEDGSEQSLRLLANAGEAAAASGNSDVAPAIVMNMIIVSTNEKSRWTQFAPLARKLTRIPGGEDASLSDVVEGWDAYMNADTAEATRLIQSALSGVGKHEYAERYRYSLLNILSYIYREGGDYGRAATMLKQALAEAERGGHSDYELMMYSKLARVYTEAERPDSADFYAAKYDSLSSVMSRDNGFGNVGTLDFLNDIDRINAQVEQLSFKQVEERRKRTLILSVLVVAVVVLLALSAFYINLKKNHRKLFIRNQDMMAREEQHRQVRQQLSEENKRLASMIEEQMQCDAEHEPNVPEEKDEEKQTESRDSFADWAKLYTRILEVAESTSEIYSAGFSINDLAGMLGVPPRSISRAINVCHNTNFHTFINEYRIREVMRLMQEPSMSRHTIEYIAEQAGFRSRSSFSQLFKKMTGLTPTAFMKMSAEKRADTQPE